MRECLMTKLCGRECPDKQCSIKKTSHQTSERVYRKATETDQKRSISETVKGWFVNLEFSQVARSSQVVAVAAEVREIVPIRESMYGTASAEKKQKYDQYLELTRTWDRVVCLRIRD